MESLDTIFLNAQEISNPAERAAYLAKECGADADLRTRVEAMLRDAEGAEAFFGPQDGLTHAADTPSTEGPGSVIGRYKLLQKIGEGGMGVVYMAEQREPVIRKVALKIIKLGMDTRQVVARFEAERQALALMDHPNIAKILDAGVTEVPHPAAGQPLSSSDEGRGQGEGSRALATGHSPLTTHYGRPYFVMDLVQGLPITRFCNEANLSTRDRLDLFLEVCSAIQHAHQKGIIHRDIKPSNILVTLHGDKPVPKVIDFGIAKATQGRLTEKTLFTQFQHFIGTPAYMSPEQASLSGLDIDTRSDIYGLGVLLYELLTGKTPFDGKELLKAGLDEMRRIIREEEPPKPSTRLTDLVAADVRRLTPSGSEEDRASLRRLLQVKERLISALRGDLDWIVMKCLEKDRARRYETANGLTADIRRHLNNEPVIARPPSVSYRFQKMVRRNKLAFAATAAVAFALLAGIGATSWQAVRARRAEQQQRVERARAEHRYKAAMRFFDQAFNSVAPALADIIGAAQPREQLARAAADALDDLRQGDEPDAASRAVLGQLYYQLAMSHGWFMGNTTGDYQTALKAVTNAIDLFESAAAASPSDILLDHLFFAEQGAGVIFAGLLKPQEAIEHFQKSHQWATRLGEQTTNSDTRSGSAAMKGWAIGNIGEMLVRMDRCEEAITNYILPELARVRERGTTDQSPNIWDVWDLKGVNDNLGMAYYRLERYREALPYLREALRFIEVINKRPAHSAGMASALAVVRAEVGEVLLRLNQPEEGLQLLRDAAKQADDLAGRDPANAGFTQAQIEVSWRSAAGCAVWANDPSAPLADRRARLDQAQTHLDRAQTLLAGLKSESLRKYLEADLRSVSVKVAHARARLEANTSAEPKP